MATYIRFQTNIPQRMALQDTAGEEVEGQYGKQFFHRTTDGRAVYLEPVVQAKIEKLGIQAGEQIEVCKTETVEAGRKIKVWKVRSLLEGLQPEREFPRPTAPAPNATSNAQPNQPATQPQSIAAPRVNQSAAASVMGGCLCAAIDSLLFTQRYAKEQGVRFEFDEEAIRGVGISIFIQSFREAEARAKQQGRAA